MKNIKTYYVTGCCGFIGSHLTRTLLEQGNYVIGVDKLTYAARPKLVKEFRDEFEGRFEFIRGDINELQYLLEHDVFINTCAETHVGNSIINSKEFINSNTYGVYHILELLKNYRSETSQSPLFIHFSTDEVYGDIFEGAHKETDILKPSNPYSASKAAADMLILAWARTYSIPYIIVRPTNNYGMGQNAEKLIPKVCKCLKFNKRIPLHNNGSPIRNWLHVSDTVNAIITIINSNIKNDIFNINGNFERKNLDIVTEVIRLYKGVEGFYNPRNDLDLSYSRPGQDIRYALDDSKLRKLGWDNKAVFEEELEKIVKYNKAYHQW